MPSPTVLGCHWAERRETSCQERCCAHHPWQPRVCQAPTDSSRQCGEPLGHQGRGCTCCRDTAYASSPARPSHSRGLPRQKGGANDGQVCGTGTRLPTLCPSHSSWPVCTGWVSKHTLKLRVIMTKGDKEQQVCWRFMSRPTRQDRQRDLELETTNRGLGGSILV